MSDTLAEKINKLELMDGCSVDLSLALGEQVEKLETKDIVTLNRFGKEFPIPPKIELESHLSAVELNPFLAEPLLREGSLLLDRCLQQRREHDELKTKLFEACIQIDELHRLNIITSKEEKDYHIPKDIAQSEKDALQAEEVSIAEQLKQLKQVENLADRRPGHPEIDLWAFQKGNVILDQIRQNGLNNINAARIKGANSNFTQKENLKTYQEAGLSYKKFISFNVIIKVSKSSANSSNWAFLF